MVYRLKTIESRIQVKEDRKAALEKNLQKAESWPYNLSLKRRNSLGNDSDAKRSKVKES